MYATYNIQGVPKPDHFFRDTSLTPDKVLKIWITVIYTAVAAFVFVISAPWYKWRYLLTYTNTNYYKSVLFSGSSCTLHCIEKRPTDYIIRPQRIDSSVAHTAVICICGLHEHALSDCKLLPPYMWTEKMQYFRMGKQNHFSPGNCACLQRVLERTPLPSVTHVGSRPSLKLVQFLIKLLFF